MARLKAGSIIIDLPTGGVYGDLDHCPREDLLESAEALLSLLPRVRHQGLWGLGKAYDADCYLWTAARHYRVPDGLTLEQDIRWGSLPAPPEPRPVKVLAFTVERDDHWRRGDWWSKLVGSVRDGSKTPYASSGKVTPDTQGIPVLNAEEVARHAREDEERKALRGKNLADQERRERRRKETHGDQLLLKL